MASIPLPALAVRPPQEQDPMGNMARMVQLASLLKAQPLQQQALQQQVEGGALQNQVLQNQVDQTKAVNQAYKDAFSVDDQTGQPKLDTAKLTKSLSDAGHGSAVPAIVKGVTEFQTSQADLQKKQSDLQVAAQDSMGSLGAAFKQAKYDPNLALTLLQDRLSQPNLPPQVKQQLLGFQQKLSTADPQTASSVVQQIAENWIAQSPKQRELAAQETAANARKQIADTGASKELYSVASGVMGAATDQATWDSRRNFLMQSQGLSDDQMSKMGIPRQYSLENAAMVKELIAQKTQTPEMMSMQDWLQKHPGKGPSDYEQAKAGWAPAAKFNLQMSGAGGSTFSSLNPGQKATVQAIIEGRQEAPSGFALSTPYWQAVMGGVYEQDPQWNQQRAQLRKSYTVGKQSTEINAINTATGHIGVLNDAIDALNNGNVKLLNGLANSLGVQVGSDATTTFNTIVHRVGPEISKAYVGAGGSAGERGADEKDFDPSLGPQQLKSNAAITAKLLRSKISSLENQWDQNKSDSMPNFQQRFIMPEAQKTLNKLAPEQGGAALKGPIQAGEHVAVGAGNHQIVYRQGKWVDPQTGEEIK